jgi:hypothetical protein
MPGPHRTHLARPAFTGALCAGLLAPVSMWDPRLPRPQPAGTNVAMASAAARTYSGLRWMSLRTWESRRNAQEQKKRPACQRRQGRTPTHTIHAHVCCSQLGQRACGLHPFLSPVLNLKEFIFLFERYLEVSIIFLISAVNFYYVINKLIILVFGSYLFDTDLSLKVHPYF